MERSERDRRRIQPSRMNRQEYTPPRKITTYPAPVVEDFSISDASSAVQMTIKGHPHPWARPLRPRRRRGQQNDTINPNAGKQTQLHDAIKEALKKATGRNRISSPVFGRDVALSLDVTFYINRPPYHFPTRNYPRYAGTITPQYKDKACTCAPDVDNLVKFIMDKPFKGLLLHDDRQVISIYARKAYDIFGKCDGHTVVALSRV